MLIWISLDCLQLLMWLIRKQCIINSNYFIISNFETSEVHRHLHHYRGQTTVENCIGGHVNVLSDYKKT